MRYNNRFFRTEGEAKDFRKQHGGRLLHITPRSKLQTRMDFHAEMLVAMDARSESVDPEITPWCVAWNEKD